MLGLLIFTLTVVASIWGFRTVRRFVREKLRYVDAAQSSIAPWAAAGGAILISAPLVALVPGVGLGSALVLSAAVGFGVARGARDIRYHERQLAPWS